MKKIGGFNYTGNLGWLNDSVITLVKHGSVAYGLNTESSDLDVKGICIPPKDYYIGLHAFEQAEFKDPENNAELVVYELKKFIRLAADSNPNVMEILWVDESDILIQTDIGELLRENRGLFVTKMAKFKFAGYAYSQLKRIKTHRSWLLNPIETPPLRSTFGLPEHRLISKDQMGAFNEFESKGEETKFGKDVLDLFLKEKQYAAARLQYDQYQNWKDTRNPNRAALEAKFGLDTKHAMHLVRLMKMCREILETGKVNVKRVDDREELLGIRNGAMSYDDIIEWAEKQEKELDELYETSTLQRSSDKEEINQLCMKLIEMKLNSKK